MGGKGGGRPLPNGDRAFSLIAACLLKSQGIGVDEAFAMISRARGFSVPDTKNRGNGWRGSLSFGVSMVVGARAWYNRQGKEDNDEGHRPFRWHRQSGIPTNKGVRIMEKRLEHFLRSAGGMGGRLFRRLNRNLRCAAKCHNGALGRNFRSFNSISPRSGHRKPHQTALRADDQARGSHSQRTFAPD